MAALEGDETEKKKKNSNFMPSDEGKWISNVTAEFQRPCGSSSDKRVAVQLGKLAATVDPIPPSQLTAGNLIRGRSLFTQREHLCFISGNHN